MVSRIFGKVVPHVVFFIAEGGDDASSADRVEDFCVEDEVLFAALGFASILKTLRAIESGRGCGRHR